MVQKEVTKKSRTYGITGILLAIILVATIYSFGTIPGIPLPNVSSPEGVSGQHSTMTTFASYNDLVNFLDATGSNNGYYGNSRNYDLAPMPAPTTVAATAETNGAGNTQSKDYSTTNIQVAGVDEADTIKTDGNYLYVIGNGSQAVYIVDANPQNAKVLAKLYFNDSQISGIYLSADGNKLAVLGNQYVYDNVYPMLGAPNSVLAILPRYYMSSTNFLYVYDLANKANPVLARNVTVTGDYLDSRMIGNYVYDIITESAFVVNGTAVLPTIINNQEPYNVAATSIYYANTTGSYYTYTTVTAVDIMNDAAAPSNLTIMMGTGSIYVSATNIYVTYPIFTYETTADSTVKLDPASTGNDVIGIAPMPAIWQPAWQGTAIYRIQISDSSLTFVAQGNVTGSVMGQYSMDEYNGNFRIATTSYDYNSSGWWSATSQNNLYVLNSDLQVIGKIENLASGENLYAARFMGDRAYLVTFQQVDPLFVIDLATPTNPTVLGNLTIPGYSNFLQPYDATHLIGIGQDVNASIDANKVETPGAVYYTAVLGLKVSLFDVTDVANPQEISKIVIGDRGTYSNAFSDAKAILFDKSKNLLVLPIDLYLNANVTTNQGTGRGVTQPAFPSIAPEIYSYPQFAWQGVYVFNISLSQGITVKGNLTQLDNADALLANPSLAMMDSYMWLNYDQFITRSLYIDNTLYTFSQSRIQLNNLSDLSLVARIDLQ
jgi:inhibitor of cysteine peptidase